MNLFFLDVRSSKKCDYVGLFEFLNSEPKVQLNYRSPDTIGFFKNFILGIIYDLPLIILDLDISDDEYQRIMGESYEPKIVNLPAIRKKVTSLNIAELLLKSSAQITIFTSGTTGLPKMVVHSIRGLTREARFGEKYKMDSWAFAYNPTHMAGLQLFFQAILNQNSIINVFNLPREKILETIQKYSLTNISATPSFFRLLLPVEKKLTSLKKVTLGGEKANSDLVKSIFEMFPNSKVYNIYATTEFGTILSTTGEYFKISNKYNNLVRINHGVLEVHVSLLGQTSTMVCNDEWYNTGDLVEFKSNSTTEFKLKGRDSELINVGGNKVNPSEVESAIFSCFPQIKECHVFGIPNSILGSIVCAEIVLHENSELSENELRFTLNNILQNFKVPRKISFVAAINKNRAGKIVRKNHE